MKKIVVILLISAFVFSSACQIRSEATEPAPVDDQDFSESTTASDSSAFESTSDSLTESVSGEYNQDLTLLFDAYLFTDSQNNREIQTMVYTKQGNSSQSINLNVIMRGMHTGSPSIKATGNVKAKERLIPFEMYYSESVLYSGTAESKKRFDADFETAACSIDVLRSFKKALLAENISEIQVETEYDGKQSVKISFSGVNTGEVMADGTGEIIIDPSGIISFETYNMESRDDKGNTVRQSVESSLICYGENTPEIIFPDFGEY